MKAEKRRKFTANGRFRGRRSAVKEDLPPAPSHAFVLEPTVQVETKSSQSGFLNEQACTP